ncbi:MAG: HAD hydrolase family protein [Saprospiraceae bacterium]
MNGVITIVDMNVFGKLQKIRGMVLDIDGVFTDNQILVTENGEFLRLMNVRDGYAVKRAVAAGLRIAIISGGKSLGTIRRMNVLGVHEVFLGVEKKLPVLKDLLKQWDMVPDEIVYMGDDLPDLECLQYVGLASCPSDAVPEILSACEYVATLRGGQGCVRELIEHILQSQNRW